MAIGSSLSWPTPGSRNRASERTHERGVRAHARAIRDDRRRRLSPGTAHRDRSGGFSPTPVFDLPVDGASLRWYAGIGSLEGLRPALAVSLEIAILSTAASLVLGTLAGVAIARGAVPGGEAFAAALVSPLMMPGWCLRIALAEFRRLRIDPALALMLAHVVVTLPYVARTMIAALSRFDFTLLDAARARSDAAFPRRSFGS